ncbi:MAG: hypothetical protein ABFD92_13865 [Planctomycetaceae bacterium]|nr:hypothetical protein [Planctomycetaceae bacterium]
MNARMLSLAVLAGLAMILGGCKTSNIMFVNDTGRDTEVSLQGPGKIEPTPPILPVANRGTASFTVTTDPADMPANYVWQAAGRRGTVVVSKQSPDHQIVNLATGTASDSTAPAPR